MINTNPLDNFGYYLAKDKKYYSKVEAIMSLPLNDQDLRWWFHDEAFSAFDWTTEPAETLDQLYLERAKQLRDQYDYLVLCYSGGADSTQILETFVNNNIYIDEINFHGAFSTDKTRDPLSKDPSFLNVEIYHVAEPRIQEVKKKWPNMVVNYYDWSNDTFEIYTKDKNYDWIYAAGCRFCPNMVARGNLHNYTRELRKLHDSNKKVGYIWGIDKPRVILQDGNWYIFFLDVLVSLGTNMQAQLSGLVNEVDELFYWSPNSTKLLAKQAHSVKRYIQSDSSRFEFFKQVKINNLHVETYYDLIKPAIYPNTHRPDIFQCNKGKPIYTERDWWFYDQDNRSYQIWQDGLKQITNAIGTNWLNGGEMKNGLMGSISKFYKFA